MIAIMKATMLIDNAMTDSNVSFIFIPLSSGPAGQDKLGVLSPAQDLEAQSL